MKSKSGPRDLVENLIVLSACFALHSCGGSDGPVQPPAQPPPEVTDPDPPLAVFSVKDSIAQAFSRSFGFDVPEPAFGVSGAQYLGIDDLEPTTYWTSTVYADSSENASDILKWTLYRVYVGEAGQLLQSNIVQHGRRPWGNHRVLVVAIDYGNTNIAEVLDDEWLDAQQEINQALIDLAASQGFAEPILRFSNTNILVDRSEIENPERRQDVEAVAREKGYEPEDYDILVTLDLDTQNPVSSSGTLHDGFTNGRNFVYMGFVFGGQTGFADLSRLVGFLTQKVYDHQIGHIFGWEHSWTRQDGGFFITQPDLYGWTDVDGDGIREIEDPTPYGRSWEW